MPSPAVTEVRVAITTTAPFLPWNRAGFVSIATTPRIGLGSSCWSYLSTLLFSVVFVDTRKDNDSQGCTCSQWRRSTFGEHSAGCPARTAALLDAHFTNWLKSTVRMSDLQLHADFLSEVVIPLARKKGDTASLEIAERHLTQVEAKLK